MRNLSTTAARYLLCAYLLAMLLGNHLCGAEPASTGSRQLQLFDGKSLAGWVQIPPDSWEVREGAMTSRGTSRGVIYTERTFDHYRLTFLMRHVGAEQGRDHEACFLIFCTHPTAGSKPLDALGGIQFQPPRGGHWDYRPGHNNDGGEFFNRIVKPTFDSHQWSRLEILVNAGKGTARMAVAQPVDSKAVEVLRFHDPSAGKKGPIAWQIHNQGLYDQYKEVAIEINPVSDELLLSTP